MNPSKHRSCYSLIWIQLSSICAEKLIAQIFLWSLYETLPLFHLRNEAFVSSADNHGSNSCLSVASYLWGFFRQVFMWVWFRLLSQDCEITPPVSPKSFPWVRVFLFQLFHHAPPLPAEFRCSCESRLCYCKNFCGLWVLCDMIYFGKIFKRQ